MGRIIYALGAYFYALACNLTLTLVEGGFVCSLLSDFSTLFQSVQDLVSLVLGNTAQFHYLSSFG